MNQSLIIALIFFILGALVGSSIVYFSGACKSQNKEVVFRLQAPDLK